MALEMGFTLSDPTPVNVDAAVEETQHRKTVLEYVRNISYCSEIPNIH